MKRLVSLVVLSIGFVIWSERSALAYFDAATGGLILQALLGGVAGFVVLVRLYWRRLTHQIKGNSVEEVSE